MNSCRYSAHEPIDVPAAIAAAHELAEKRGSLAVCIVVVDQLRDWVAYVGPDGTLHGVGQRGPGGICCEDRHSRAQERLQFDRGRTNWVSLF